MQMIRFLPTDDVPPGYKNPLPVDTVPRSGDHVYLNGVHFVVEHVAHFFQGGSVNAVALRQPILVNLIKTGAVELSGADQ